MAGEGPPSTTSLRATKKVVDAACAGMTRLGRPWVNAYAGWYYDIRLRGSLDRVPPRAQAETGSVDSR